MPTGPSCRPGRRALRETPVAIALSMICACTTHSLEAPMPAPAQAHTTTFQDVNRKLDILFMVDNSSSMTQSQSNLLANFPIFMNVLTGLPGGLPSIHIAVVSSDMGAGNGLAGPCVGNGDAGRFQSTARGGCDTTLMDGAHYISNAGGVANYTAPIEQVFTCLAALGDDGCGFEQPLLSVAAALGLVSPGAPPENAGFLRDDAYLAIILITNEDDCSAPSGSSNELFTDPTGKLAGQLGPPQGYRCNEFGHLCGNPLSPPLRLAPGGDPAAKVTLDGCVPAEDKGKLIPVANLAAAIKQLKPDPDNQILVAAITGPTTPYTVGWRPTTSSDSGPWPTIEHSCVATDDSYADPAIRISNWVEHFGTNGVIQSICDASFRPAMTRIASEIGRVIGPKCVTARFADRDGNAANGVQYDCTASSHPKGDGQSHPTAVPACDQSNGARPCWRFAEDANCVVPPNAAPGTTSKRLVVDRDNPAETEIDTDVSCSICPPGFTDPRCP